MKRIGLRLMAILLVAFPLFFQNVVIPDTAFLYALIDEGVDTNEDGQISYAEAEAIVSLNVSREYQVNLERFTRWDIGSLSGIEAIANLTTIDCSRNSLTSLDVSKNTALRELSCTNSIT